MHECKKSMQPFVILFFSEQHSSILTGNEFIKRTCIILEFNIFFFSLEIIPKKKLGSFFTWMFSRKISILFVQLLSGLFSATTFRIVLRLRSTKLINIPSKFPFIYIQNNHCALNAYGKLLIWYFFDNSTGDAFLFCVLTAWSAVVHFWIP